MGWKLRKERRLTSSRSTGDLLKSVRVNRGALLHRATTYVSLSGGKDPRGVLLRTNGSNYAHGDPLESGDLTAAAGHLYVLTDGGFWFRMWVKLGGERLETFYSSSDKLPLQVVHLADGSTSLVIPATIEADCPEDFLFPLHVVKKEQPVICLATENSRDQERWATAIQNCLQTRSLDIEGLNLECSSSVVGRTGAARESAVAEAGQERNSLLNKLDLLEELLAQRDKCGDLGKDKKTMDLCQKMVDADNWYDRILISEQQEALRRATYLRQRKISTQLKADTIRKQLSKSSKSGKRRPKSLCVSETEEAQEFYEEQLEELNNKLQNIHTSLGKTELQAEVAYRKLGRKRESELKRLHSDADLGGVGGGAPSSFLKRSSDPHLPTICVSRSQEDCRVERKPSKGSVIRKNSPKSVKKYLSDGLKFSSSTTSIWEPSPKKCHGSANQNSSTSSTKNRISPLRLLGNFVDNQLLRARNKGKKMEENPALNRKSESDSAEEAENCPRRSWSSVNDTSCRGLVDERATPPHLIDFAEAQLGKRSSTSSEKLRTEIDPNALAEIEAFESLTEQFLQDFQQVK